MKKTILLSVLSTFTILPHAGQAMMTPEDGTETAETLPAAATMGAEESKAQSPKVQIDNPDYLSGSLEVCLSRDNCLTIAGQVMGYGSLTRVFEEQPDFVQKATSLCLTVVNGDHGYNDIQPDTLAGIKKHFPYIEKVTLEGTCFMYQSTDWQDLLALHNLKKLTVKETSRPPRDLPNRTFQNNEFIQRVALPKMKETGLEVYLPKEFASQRLLKEVREQNAFQPPR